MKAFGYPAGSRPHTGAPLQRGERGRSGQMYRERERLGEVKRRRREKKRRGGEGKKRGRGE